MIPPHEHTFCITATSAPALLYLPLLHVGCKLRSEGEHCYIGTDDKTGIAGARDQIGDKPKRDDTMRGDSRVGMSFVVVVRYP